jgi:hypothetical protein
MTDREMEEAEAPERIWAVHGYVAGMTNILSGHIMLEPTEIAETTEYVRADLVEAKLAQVQARLEKIAAADTQAWALCALADIKGESGGE